MAKQDKAKKKADKQRPRRTRNVILSSAQRQALIDLWNSYHGGIPAFAEQMAEKENPDANDVTTATAAKVRALHRIEDGDTGVSQAIFTTTANVLGITTEALKNRISAPTPGETVSPLMGPWITDEKVLAEYRRVYYGYYYTKQGEEYFWMHHQIDFSKPYKGCLHAINNYGIDRPIYYKVYAYLFREMLVAITQSEEERNQLESVSIYHDFCRRIREGVGHFGIRVNEDWNSDFGAGASIIFRQPFPGTEKEGRQSPAMCKKLTEYWKHLGGERCNRLLHLFDYEPYSRSANAAKELNSERALQRRARSAKRK